MAPSLTPARARISVTGTPRHAVSSLDQRVTQWMSVTTSFWGSSINSSQLSFSRSSTSPKTAKSHVFRSNFGFGPDRQDREPLGQVLAGRDPLGVDAELLCLPATAVAEYAGSDRHAPKDRIADRRSPEGPTAPNLTLQGAPRHMAYVIAEPCIGTKDNSCVEVCPVDCIHPTPDEPDYDTVEMLYIDPDECIDCDACVEACPVDACFAEDQLPDEWQKFAQINADYYKNAG